jgi:GT2 family glycosyltransferase
MNGIAAVVVTYNRVALLKDCIAALLAQTYPPSIILVINNASSDGTSAYLDMLAKERTHEVSIANLAENTGGAGGFSEGLQLASSNGTAWAWMMDDDAAPHPSALEELMKVATDPRNVYGSAAVCRDRTAWTITGTKPAARKIEKVADLPDQAEVEFLPFLGILVHCSMVEKIGLPDAGFFIAADDVEYCLRARRAGAKVIIAGRSHIEHPRTQRQVKRVLGHDIAYLSLAPWKRYYDTRNRLLVAHKYYGLRLLTETIPGSFVRLFAALRFEPRKGAQLWAWCCGMFDGLLGIKGKRHEKWGIRQ